MLYNWTPRLDNCYNLSDYVAIFERLCVQLSSCLLVCSSAEEYSYHIISTSGQLGRGSLIQNKVLVGSGPKKVTHVPLCAQADKIFYIKV